MAKPKSAIVRQTNVIHYLQNRYEVPLGTYLPGRKAAITVDDEAGTVTFCDKESGEELARHNIAYGSIGKKIPLPRNAQRFKETKYGEFKITVLSSYDGIYLIEEYIDKLIEKYHRYVYSNYSERRRQRVRNALLPNEQKLRDCLLLKVFPSLILISKSV